MLRNTIWDGRVSNFLEKSVNVTRGCWAHASRSHCRKLRINITLCYRKKNEISNICESVLSLFFILKITLVLFPITAFL